jgi:hypothetical protein
MIGDSKISANGTNRFVSNKKPQVTSVALSNGKKYPVDIKPFVNGTMPSAGGGVGMKFRNPLRPNTKKTSPRKTRAMVGK